jgi:hypothetical protein
MATLKKMRRTANRASQYVKAWKKRKRKADKLRQKVTP